MQLPAVLKTLGTFIDRFVWMIGLIAIMDYTHERWSMAYSVATVGFFIAVGIWYVWKFIIQPFREGMRG